MRSAILVTLLWSASVTAARAQHAPRIEHLVTPVDGHRFAVWASRPAHPRASILLVHGRTWSARPAFDFRVNNENRSVLARLSAAGYAAYAVDLRGYGETPRDSTGWLTPRRSAQDVEGILAWVATQHPGGEAPILFGWSRGSRISALVASRGRVPLSALVLSGFAYDSGAVISPVPADSSPARASNTAAAAASDFISPNVTSRSTIDAFVSSALADDPIRVDLKGDEEFHDIRPSSIHVPTLLIQGERDPGISASVEGRFFSALGTGHREWVVIPGGDHAVHLEDTFPQFMSALLSFLERAR